MNKIALNYKKVLSSFEINSKEWASFGENFNLLCSKSDFKGLIKFVSDFAINQPLGRDAVREAYKSAARSGYSILANEFALIYAKTSSKLLAIGKDALGLPPIYDYRYIKGGKSEFIEQAAYTKLMLDGGFIDKKPIYAIPAELKFPKLAILPYLQDCFEIAYEDENAKYYAPNTHLAPYSPIFYNFSDTQYGYNQNFFIDCHLDLIAKNVNPHAFNLKEETIEPAITFLKDYALATEDEFVVLFLDENSSEQTESSRDWVANPLDFVKSVEYLLKQGLKVVRVGNTNTVPMPKINGLIDLTKVHIPDEVIIFLCGRAKFYLGTESDFYSLAYCFGVPCCEIRRIDYFGLRPNNFSQYLIFEDNQTGHDLSFSNMQKLGLDQHMTRSFAKKMNLNVRLPKSEDNLAFVKDVIDYLAYGNIFESNQLYKNAKEEKRIFGGLCSRGMSLLD